MLRAHTFQSFWAGDALSPYERLCLRSFVDRGHRFDLYTFDAGLEVPAGVRVRDAAEILGEDEFFVYADGPGRGSPSAFANLFRYKLLHERGGWWVDTDVVCLADDVPPFTEFFAREDATHVNVAVLFARPGDPVIARCLARALEIGRPRRWGDTGPQLLTEILAEADGFRRAQPASLCYPLHFSEAVDAVRPSRRAALAPRLGVALFWHLWNAVLERSGIHKWCLPPRGSLLRDLVERHPVDGWAGEYDERLIEETLAAQAARARLDARCRELAAEIERRQAEIDRHRAEVSERDAALERLRAALAAQTADAERKEDALRRALADAAGARATIAALHASTSWRVTAPLRAVGRRFPRTRRARTWVARPRLDGAEG